MREVAYIRMPCPESDCNETIHQHNGKREMRDHLTKIHHWKWTDADSYNPPYAKTDVIYK